MDLVYYIALLLVFACMMVVLAMLDEGKW